MYFLLALPILGLAIVVGRYLGYPVGGWAALLFPILVLLHTALILTFCVGLCPS